MAGTGERDDDADHPTGPPSAPDSAANRLAAAVRGVIDLSVGRPVEEAVLAEAAAQLEEVAERLAGAARPGRAARHLPDHRDDPMGFFPTSPLIGWANPVAAPAVLWRVPGTDGPEVRGTVRFGYAYEGPPTCVHGGVIAGLFDEVLGAANVVAGRAGMTGTLTIRYRRPTPLLVPLEVVGRQTSAEGRKIRAWAGLYHEGKLTAEAEGLFLDVGPERILEIVTTNESANPDDVISQPLRPRSPRPLW